MGLISLFQKSAFWFLLITILINFSCKKDDTSGIPSYVKINEIRVETDFKKEGSASSNIADAWFYETGNHLGVFELPAEIPVLKSGNTDLTVFGGVKRSGISSLRHAYPFYTAFEMDTLLVEEQTITIQPVLRYKESTTFAWIEDFDDLSISMDTAYGSKVGITRVNNSDSTFEGKGSFGAFMDSEHNYFMGHSTEKFSLPRNGEDVYLEFDYKTDKLIQLHILIYTTSGGSFLIPVQVVNPKINDKGENVWNKMYSYLTPYVSSNLEAYQFQIYFESWTAADETSTYFMLDNVKLVY
ncbi:MAG: hypothetical protein ACPGEG_04530 [Salibacteraceae bacterium]